MTNQPPMTLRQRIAAFPARTGPTLDEWIAGLEHELLDHDDLPRIAKVLRADERVEIENRLADLRQRRDDTNQHVGDEPDGA